MKIHLSAVCGTAMASLAGLLREQGHEVTGSDQDVYPPMSTQLEALGIAIRSPYAEGNVPRDADLVVIGNALSRGNPEVEAVLDRRQRFVSLPALLAEQFLRPRRSLVVAGTHGKTTTASVLAFLLHRAGLDPSFLIGGVPVDFDRSYRLGKGEQFVIEGDEYDCAFFDKRPKFVHYLPEIAVVGNVEFDHADIYPDLGAVQTAFVRFLNVIPRRGLLVAGTESPALREILPKAHCRVETFGLHEGADWRAVDVRPEGGGVRFRLVRQGRHLGEFVLPLAGEHNVRNALGALAAAAATGVDPEAVRPALRAFGGVRRRLEVRGRAAGVTVYDDFAHHPTAVRATLVALRSQAAGVGAPAGRSDGRVETGAAGRGGGTRAASGEDGSGGHEDGPGGPAQTATGAAPMGGGRLVAVFEPRSYTSRTRRFQDAFAEALAAADRVVVAAAHLPARIPVDERISEPELVAAVRGRGAEADFVPTVEGIVETLRKELRPGDRVVMLSNGGFGGIHEKLLKAIENVGRVRPADPGQTAGTDDSSVL